MKRAILATALLGIVISAVHADDYYLKRRPSGRYDVRDSYGNSVGSMKRTPSGRYRIETYDYAPRYRTTPGYFYTTPYPSSNPGMYYQFNADGSYQWYYSY